MEDRWTAKEAETVQLFMYLYVNGSLQDAQSVGPVFIYKTGNPVAVESILPTRTDVGTYMIQWAIPSSDPTNITQYDPTFPGPGTYSDTWTAVEVSDSLTTDKTFSFIVAPETAPDTQLTAQPYRFAYTTLTPLISLGANDYLIIQASEVNNQLTPGVDIFPDAEIRIRRNRAVIQNFTSASILPLSNQYAYKIDTATFGIGVFEAQLRYDIPVQTLETAASMVGSQNLSGGYAPTGNVPRKLTINLDAALHPVTPLQRDIYFVGTASPAYQTTTNAVGANIGPISSIKNNIMYVSVNGGSNQTITFNANLSTTLVDIIDKINNTPLLGAYASAGGSLGTRLRITSNLAGASSSIQIGAGTDTINSTVGLTDGQAGQGTDLTHAEIVTSKVGGLISADVVGWEQGEIESTVWAGALKVAPARLKLTYFNTVPPGPTYNLATSPSPIGPITVDFASYTTALKTTITGTIAPALDFSGGGIGSHTFTVLCGPNLGSTRTAVLNTAYTDGYALAADITAKFYACGPGYHVNVTYNGARLVIETVDSGYLARIRVKATSTSSAREHIWDGQVAPGTDTDYPTLWPYDNYTPMYLTQVVAAINGVIGTNVAEMGIGSNTLKILSWDYGNDVYILAQNDSSATQYDFAIQRLQLDPVATSLQDYGYSGNNVVWYRLTGDIADRELVLTTGTRTLSQLVTDFSTLGTGITATSVVDIDGNPQLKISSTGLGSGASIRFVNKFYPSAPNTIWTVLDDLGFGEAWVATEAFTVPIVVDSTYNKLFWSIDGGAATSVTIPGPTYPSTYTNAASFISVINPLLAAVGYASGGTIQAYAYGTGNDRIKFAVQPVQPNYLYPTFTSTNYSGTGVGAVGCDINIDGRGPVTISLTTNYGTIVTPASKQLVADAINSLIYADRRYGSTSIYVACAQIDPSGKLQIISPRKGQGASVVVNNLTGAWAAVFGSPTVTPTVMSNQNRWGVQPSLATENKLMMGALGVGAITNVLGMQSILSNVVGYDIGENALPAYVEGGIDITTVKIYDKVTDGFSLAVDSDTFVTYSLPINDVYSPQNFVDHFNQQAQLFGQKFVSTSFNATASLFRLKIKVDGNSPIVLELPYPFEYWLTESEATGTDKWLTGTNGEMLPDSGNWKPASGAASLNYTNFNVDAFDRYLRIYSLSSVAGTSKIEVLGVQAEAISTANIAFPFPAGKKFTWNATPIVLGGPYANIGTLLTALQATAIGTKVTIDTYNSGRLRIDSTSDFTLTADPVPADDALALLFWTTGTYARDTNPLNATLDFLVAGETSAIIVETPAPPTYGSLDWLAKTEKIGGAVTNLKFYTAQQTALTYPVGHTVYTEDIGASKSVQINSEDGGSTINTYIGFNADGTSKAYGNDGSYYPLSGAGSIVDMINAAFGAQVASDSGGFLRLTSLTEGVSSSIQIVSGDAEILSAFGLLTVTTTGTATVRGEQLIYSPWLQFTIAN